LKKISPAKIGVLATAFSSLEHVIHHRDRLPLWLFILTAGLAEIIKASN
jgi:hypothetical protein